ncbi:MAG: class I SAM-dependent methyltransferase [Deltaproteobacteria bacterium]|nr:class I SAM-dependent methyltransferase [Deltaproteobacteria bacterium]
MRCHVCSSKTDYFARNKVLGKYPVAYYRCSSCGFIQTEEPYWLEEAYSEAITGSDVGLVSRNLRLSQITQSVIRACFNPQGRYIDYGGGYGLLVRLMRDAGFDFRWYDKYCVNLFAQGYAAVADDAVQYDLVTAFELVEHMRAPLEEMEGVLSYSRNLLISTEILPSSAPQPDAWWYYGLDHGQHISFFTIDSLKIMARKLSLNFVTNGTSLHMFTEKRFSDIKFKMASIYGIAFLSNILHGKKSLLSSDYVSTHQVYEKVK